MEIKFLSTPAPWLCPENVLGGGLAQHISTHASLSVCQDLTRTPLTLAAPSPPPVPSPGRYGATLPLEGKAPGNLECALFSQGPWSSDPSLDKVCVLSP